VEHNILVTGGFGFVGSHLIDLLTKKYPEARVHVVDNLSTSALSPQELLDELGARTNLTYDICSVEDFCKKKKRTKWDKIYHLASVVGPAGVLEHAGNIIKSIVLDTYMMIDIALKCNARLVYVSSSEVYGRGKKGYCSELMEVRIPPKTTVRLEYGAGKLAAEIALINTVKVSSLDTVIIRPFNISGPRQSGRGGFVLPRFIASAIKNLPITVFGSGKQIRAFTHVYDIVKGIVAGMEKGKRGQVYNLGNPKNKTTIDQLADMVIKLTKTSSKKVYLDPKTIYGQFYEEANDKYPDASKSMRELEWSPEFSKEQIILDTYKYMKNINKNKFDRLAGKL